MSIRTTEQIAPATIAELIPKLTQLTTEQPTTSEIEEAVLISRAITRALLEWVSSRHLNQSHSMARAEFTESHPAVAAAMLGLQRLAGAKAYGLPQEPDTLNPAEEEAFDELEARRIDRSHPMVFNPIEEAFRQVRPA